MRHDAQRSVLKIVEPDRLPWRRDDALNTRHSRIAVRVGEIYLSPYEDLPPIPTACRQSQRQPYRQPCPWKQIAEKFHRLWSDPISCGGWHVKYLYFVDFGRILFKKRLSLPLVETKLKGNQICCSNSSNLDVRRTRFFAEIRKVRRFQN